MNLVKWNNTMPVRSPLSTLFDDFFNTSIADVVGADFTTDHPSVNITEENDKYTLAVAAPGINRSDLNIEVDKDHLIISAKQTVEENKGEPGKYTRREFNYSSFTRSFYLPKTVDKESVEASYHDGILSIELHKKEEAKDKAPAVIDIK